MSQQISPYIEAKYGWDFGESGWNSGMDENLLKFSFLLGKGVDSIVSSLPTATEGLSVYLTTDNRLYFVVKGVWYSSPTPKWFSFTIKSTGLTYQFDGTSLVEIPTPGDLDSRIDLVQDVTDSLGTAAFQDVEDFITPAQLDILESVLTSYTDELRDDIANTTDDNKGAELVGFRAEGGGVGGRTVKDKLSNIVDLTDFLKLYGDGPYTHSQTLDACTAAWEYALLVGKDLYAPSGVYEIGENSFPWRQQIVSGLLDCKNITIYGDGPTTIFKTNSIGGADVFQLNGLKNFHIRNLKITAELQAGASGAGSNGISVTNGWDNITIKDVWCENLPSLDKSTYIDGGKALTLQSDASTNECGTLKASIFAKGCAQGFGFESDLDNFLSKKVSVDVDLVAEDCYVAVVGVAAAASATIPPGTSAGVTVRGQAINCQKDVALNRMHGFNVDIQVITTKSITERTLDPSGSVWFTNNQAVNSVELNYAKNSTIKVTGNKGDCVYKANIGATTAGSSGQNGATEFCDIYLDIGGTASAANINDVLSGGETMRNCSLYVSSTTATTIPASFYTETNNNLIVLGPVARLINPVAAGKLSLAFSGNGTTETGVLDAFDSLVTGLQGKSTSAPGAVVAGLYDAAGNFRLGVCNGTGVVVDVLGTSAAIGAYVGKQPVYDKSGTLLGYFPIYN